MRSNRMVICLFSLGLILIGIIASSFHGASEVMLPGKIFFQLGTGDTLQTIEGWENDENTVFVFLPGYADLLDIRVRMAGEGRYLIEGEEISDGHLCGAYALDKEYVLTMQTEDRMIEKGLVFLRSGQLPAMYIDVQSGSMDYIHMDISNQESGTICLYGQQGEMLYTGTLDTVKGRGNTSWYAEKKPYNITLSQEADLLGMGAAKRWILLSEGDNPVNIRNRIVYDFAKHTGLSYTPDCRWVDLYLNGGYAGVYLLTERNEVHPQRVALPETDSFLVSMEDVRDLERKGVPYIDLGTSQVLRVRHGDVNDQTISQAFIALRNALLSPDGTDAATGKHWQELIDLDSWVRKYLIEEIFANQDGGAVSQFFYGNGTDPQKRIYAGPVWDYDFAMGGEGLWLRNYDAFLTMAREYTDDEMYVPWFYELYQEDAFYDRLTELYEAEFLPLLQQLVETELDRYSQEILDSSRTDSIRWGRSAEEVRGDLQFIRTFLKTRIDFLSDLWLHDSAYHIVHVVPGQLTSGYFAVKDGETLPQFPDADVLGGIGWYHAGSEEPADLTAPIHEDMHIYLKKPETGLPVVHLVPVAAMAAILAGLAGMSLFRDKKNRRRDHDAAKTA